MYSNQNDPVHVLEILPRRLVSLHAIDRKVEKQGKFSIKTKFIVKSNYLIEICSPIKSKSSIKTKVL